MSDYLAAALGATDWIASLGREKESGLAWPQQEGAYDEASGFGVPDLYAGVSGLVLLFVEAYRTAGDRRYLDLARSGTTYLTGIAGELQASSGLYSGLAGLAFALDEFAACTGEPADEEAVRAILDQMCETATPVGDGVEWVLDNDGSPWIQTDIIGGIAGTALALAAIGRRLGHGRALDTARAAGNRLLAIAEPGEGGLRWGFTVGPIQRYMPNFSHGTAGNAYALATLGQWLGNDVFVDAALRGAEHLVAIARREDDGFKVPHWLPGGEEAFPLGWCHGPTGTARLFRRLHLATGEQTWSDLTLACARTVRSSGIPERKFPGFWDNVSPCCGSTRVAETFYDLYRITDDPDMLAFARTMTDDILARAITDERGVRWSNIEFRNDPPELPASTGFMQGSAGIAAWLFRFARALDGDLWAPAWPDSPWLEPAS